ncbi:hypothetical protein NQ317_014715 [Molorchus minor]|uniref:MaoC-like domain-containing protein n=1 Tax=Molorchus minor TaxID=1323400 RepID=A0ABQ9JXR4_9CUCU|nr:hypothetical protein NQ317_014715 [Molorchus minor]
MVIKNCLRKLSDISRIAQINYKVGDQVTVSRKITKEDVDNFMRLSGDTNPIHASGTSKNPIVHGALLNSIVSSVIGTRLPGPGTVVVQQTLNFPNKCLVGETVNVTVKLVDDRKIIKVEFRCETKNETVLMNRCPYKDVRKMKEGGETADLILIWGQSYLLSILDTLHVTKDKRNCRPQNKSPEFALNQLAESSLRPLRRMFILCYHGNPGLRAVAAENVRELVVDLVRCNLRYRAGTLCSMT